jgi:hypothetical protein
VDEVTENREGAGLGLLDRKRDRIADAKAHAKMGGSKDSHICVTGSSRSPSMS